MVQSSPLTVFYDGGCNLCNKEIRHYKRLDRMHQILWIDIATSRHNLADYDLTFEDAMSELHATRGNGENISGVDAFIAIWETLQEYRWLAAAAKLVTVKKVLVLIYPHFARWRLKRRCKTSTCSNLNVTSSEN